MEEIKYEARYLLAVLSAVLNNKKTPASARHINWERVFKIVDYHKVANVAYYGLLGLGEEIPSNWQVKFFEKYQDAVIKEELLHTAEEVMTWQLERSKIHCIFLKDIIIRNCYPHREMRMVDTIDILVEEGKESQIAGFMEVMDYMKQEGRRLPGKLYYRVPGVAVVFYPRLLFPNKKQQQYFDTSLLRLDLKEGYRYIHEFNNEEFYIYLVSTMVRDYACGDIDIREMIDLWTYYTTFKDQLQWDAIEKELEKLNIKDFVDHLLVLAGIWFGGKNSEELEIYDAMEAYILTKGVEGRKISSELLPLIKQVANFYERNYRKEWIKEQIKWLFPTKDYMQTIYPVLTKVPILICYCWVARLLRGLRFVIKRETRKIYEKISRPVKDKWMKFKTQIKNKFKRHKE